MSSITFFVSLSDSIDRDKLREAWREHERLHPGQPSVEFTSFDGHGFEAEADNTPPDWPNEFRRILKQVLLNVDEFCTIREIYHVGEKDPEASR
jgi:hypothetical protein